jgi:hypothetical protein
MGWRWAAWSVERSEEASRCKSALLFVKSLIQGLKTKRKTENKEE